MENRIKDLLRSTKRDGVDDLISNMEDGGFFIAPCSGAHHLCKEGGLAEHSVNVYEVAKNLNEAFDAGIPDDSLIVSCILHDLGKMGDYGKPNYVVNMVNSKKKDENGEYIKVQSESKPYETNKDLIYEEHEIRSVIIASRYIYVSEEESTAILHHNGCWGKLDSSFSSTYDKHKLATIVHFADLWCSRFVEVD